MTSSNLPPGVSSYMIPGNSRDDQICARLCDDCGKFDDDLCPYWLGNTCDCPQIEGRHDPF